MKNPFGWLLEKAFPIEPIRFHPINDLPGILGYQYRLSRTQGEEITNYVVQARVKRVIEGEYIDPWPQSDVKYSRVERPLVAVYSVPPTVVYPPSAPEPTQEQIAPEELEKCLAPSPSTESSTPSPSGVATPKSWRMVAALLQLITKLSVSRPTPTNEGNGNGREMEQSLPVA